MRERERRTGDAPGTMPDVAAALESSMEAMRHEVFAQLLARYSDYKKRTAAGLDPATVNAQLSRDFEEKWSRLDSRRAMVPGKEVLARVNHCLQDACGLTLTDGLIANQMSRATVPDDLIALMEALQDFSRRNAPD
jgi:hypothetical protein